MTKPNLISFLLLIALLIQLSSCDSDGHAACFLQRYYISNESGSTIQVSLYNRASASLLVNSWNLAHESKILFYETEGGHCILENNFVGDSLVFVFENQKRNVFACISQANYPFHAVYDDDCYSTLSSKNALDSKSYSRIDDGTTDLYYIITRIDYALAE